MCEQPTKWMLRGDAIVLVQNKQKFRIITESSSHEIQVKNNEFAQNLKALRNEGLEADLGCEPENSLLKQLDAAGLLLSAPPEGSTPIQALNWSWSETVAPGRGMQQRLRNSTVVIVGCGGTGCLIAQSLAGSGVGSFTLIDFDRVSASNLNRQFAFRAEDINKYKAKILANRLLQDQQVLEANAIVARIKSDNQLANIVKGADLIICCADEPPGEIQRLVTRSAEISEIAVLFGAVGVWHGTIGPLLKKTQEIQQYLQWSNQIHQTCEKVLVPAGFPSNGVTNAIIANLVAMEAMRYLGDLGSSWVSSCLIDLDFNNFSFTKIKNFNPD